jgi:predicted acetyltransferase
MMSGKLILRQLEDGDEALFLEGLEEWPQEDRSWYSFSWANVKSYPEMMQILREEHSGEKLRPGRVRHSMLYAFVDGRIIGRVSVRHELNEMLRRRGGHIGYAVAPRFRRKGYAKSMVKEALSFCRALGLKEIMVTCGDDNTPSWKVIEHFGGRLEDKVWDEEDKETIRRYWITL